MFGEMGLDLWRQSSLGKRDGTVGDDDEDEDEGVFVESLARERIWNDL